VAIDTRNRRASSGVHLAMPSLPLPDGALDTGDRQEVAFTYRGISPLQVALFACPALTPRQRIAYTDRMRAWFPVRTESSATGRPQAEEWCLAYSGCLCHFEIQRSTDSPFLIGRIETDNIFSRDRIYFGAAGLIEADWIIQNISLDADGSPSGLYGRYWRVVGRAQRHWNRGARHARRGAVEAIQMETAPVGIT